MKIKNSLSILVLAITICAFSQKSTMELTFTAENNGQYVPLDSIFIKNLTQGGVTTLYAPDTVLVLDYVTSIGNRETIEGNTFSVSQNYPNPFKGKTAINLYLPEKELIKITIRDILGRELAHYENILNRGNHAFSFYPANAKYYLLTVIGKQTSQTIKMLNAGSYTTNGEKCKIVYTGNKGNVSGFKSQQAINDFAFNLGDSLQYTGYANSIDGIFGSAVMQHKPQEDTIYVFDILKGLRCPGIPTVTDIDGNTYNTVQIGSQCWLKENLNVGTMINGGQNMTNNGSIEKYCYDNNLSNCINYGGLYQWDEIMQYVTTQGVQGICPTGWHVPIDDEWTALTDFIGGTPPHGNKLKSCRQVASPLGGGCNITEHPRWDQNNYAWGTDDYGFSGLPGGYRIYYGPLFVSIGGDGYWWSSTENLPDFAWARSLLHLTSYVYTNHMPKDSGFSVRCLRD